MEVSAKAIEARVKAALDRSGLVHEVLSCDPALADTDVFCANYGYPPENSANTIVVKAKTGGVRYAVCVLLAHTRLDVNRVVRKRLAARRVSFASADETKALTGMEIGGVTPLDLAEDLPLWIDERVMQCGYVILGGGSRSCKIKVSPQIFEFLGTAEIVRDLAQGPV